MLQQEQMLLEKGLLNKKCKWKNQTCDGLCNNCYAWTDGKICASEFKSREQNPYSFIYPDYEEAILARQELEY